MNLRTSPHLRNSSDCCLYKFYCSDFFFREFLILEHFLNDFRLSRFFHRLLVLFSTKTLPQIAVFFCRDISQIVSFRANPIPTKWGIKFGTIFEKHHQTLKIPHFVGLLEKSSYCRKSVNYDKSKLKSYILRNLN